MRKIALLFLLVCSFPSLSQSYYLQHGMNMFDANALDEAEKALKTEIEKHPMETRAYEYLGRVYDAQNEYQKAVQNFDLAIRHTNRLDTKRLSTLWKYKGDVFVRTQSLLDQGLECYTTALKLNSQDIAILVARANAFQELKRYNDAKLDSEAALRMDALNYDAIKQYVFALFQLKDLDLALKSANLLVTLKPTKADSYFIRGRVFEEKGEIAQAIDDAYQAILYEDSEDNRDQLIHLAELNKGLALNKADLLVKEFSRKAWMYDLRAQIHEVDESYPEAIADLTQALQVVREDEESYYFFRRGSVYDAWNCSQLAINDFNESIARDKKSAYTYQRRGYHYMLMGRVEDALRDFNAGIELNPEDEDLYHQRGYLHLYFTKNYQASLADFNRSHAINSSNVLNLIYRGRLYSSFLKMPKKAKEDFQAVISIDSVLDDHETLHYYGLLGLGKGNEAASRVEAEVAKFQSYTSHYNAACVYSILGDKEKAIAHLDSSIRKGNRDIEFIRIEPDLEFIRNDKAFQKLLAELEVKLKPLFDKESIRQSTTLTGKYAKGDFQIPIYPEKPGGSYEVKASMNGLKVDMLFDTGASNIVISRAEEQFMLKNGYLKQSDFLAESKIVIADGSTVDSRVYNLNDFELGGVHVSNVELTVVPREDAGILLGQSVFARFGKFEVDHDRKTVRFTAR